MSNQQAPGSFSLFPNPNSSRPPSATRSHTPRGRRSESREGRTPQERAVTPQALPASEPQPTPSPSRQARGRSPIRLSYPAIPPSSPPPHVQSFHVPQVPEAGPSEATSAAPGSSSQHYSHPIRRSSIAKVPLPDEDEPNVPSHQPLRSIFPTFNPNLPLDQQDYAPTQLSPGRIPRAFISRQMYHNHEEVAPSPEPQPLGQNPVSSPPLQSPMSGTSQWPRRPIQPPPVPETCSTEQLRSLWKVANGWKAATSEGRVYCLKLTQEKDSPIYTLSSATQPFYNIRVDPTSASARVAVARFDPAKTYKAPKPDANFEEGAPAPTERAEGKHWHGALITTLEEESRRHPPEDGLVALLYPTPASRVALEKANEPQAVALAERECAHLVWDDDTASYYLVHPALATPFHVSIERSPSWSRVEYTLEHHESPRHLAKLTRTGSGDGWLEFDTGIGGWIEAFYIMDVAVAALAIVANQDERNLPPPVEEFAPPPAAVLAGRGGARSVAGGEFMPPSATTTDSPSGGKSKFGFKKNKNKTPAQMEVFELDLESQDSSLGKSSRKNKNKKRRKGEEPEDKLPFVIRVVVKLAKGVFKTVLFVLTLGFKCLLGMLRGVNACFGSKY